MTEEPKHSPLPWHIAVCVGVIVIASKPLPTCLDGGIEGEIARWHGVYDKGWNIDPEVEANALLMFRRVNQGPAVDKLLEIAKDMADLTASHKYNLLDGTPSNWKSNELSRLAREFLKANEE